ncbi:MAG: YbdK family carboxylate-amine ligase [Woeseiaceae bacterium]|nr:YbdK family carboxylate-amine ligase [Woeseiaceae bacterium]NNL62969.1 YbdK family carboxylate-amine ligase [Woeseiaceae bacterium]
MKFKNCSRHTVGVEWELQLLDPETLDLYDGIMPLMEFFPDASFVKPEYIQSCVELNSDVAANSDQAVRQLRQTLERTVRRSTELDMSLCAAGTHPFSRRLALITPLSRYRRMAKSAGYLAAQQITFSTHVHIGMASGDEAMRVMAGLIPVVPALVAMSANSPFWRGHATGHVAYRHRILAAAPNYGLPTSFDDWAAFEEFLAAATRSSMIRHFKDIHWDIRPHPDFGTLEIRAMDAASDLQGVHGLVSFVRCLIVTMAQASSAQLSPLIPQDLPYWIENQNRFRASKLGMDAEYIINAKGDHRPIREFIDDLFALCLPIAPKIGESRGMQIARRMLDEVPAYQQQLDAYESGHSARAVVERLQDALLRTAAEGSRAA